MLLILYSVVTAASFWKKVSYFILSATLLYAAATWLDLGNLLLGYIDSYQNIEDKMALLGRDQNLVLGRVAALYIVPRMISAHPVTGIGIGNYPLMRNDPHYLGSLPTITDLEDLPALGIPGIAAEMGIPATLWLMALLFAPYWMSRKKASIVIGVAAIFQPLAHALGVQLTFAYPWFVSACTLAAFSYWTGRASSSAAEIPFLAPVSPSSLVSSSDPAGGTVCAPADNGKIHTYDGTFTDGTAYTEMIATLVCDGIAPGRSAYLQAG